MKKAVLIIIAIVILGAGAFWLFHKSNKTNTTTTAPSSNATGATITFNGAFSPAVITVKAGTTVTVKNDSLQDIVMNSNPHPTHTDDPDLNVGTIAAGKSATFVANQKGNFGYHDHLDPSLGGQISVE